MIQLMQIFFVTLIIFLVIDMIWLGVIARKLYRSQLGYLMKDKVNWAAALLFYAIFISGLIYFVIEPSLAGKGLGYAFSSGLFFGLVTYATYDLTNLATTKGWPVLVTVIDLAWGSVLSALTAVLSVLALGMLLG